MKNNKQKEKGGKGVIFYILVNNYSPSTKTGMWQIENKQTQAYLNFKTPCNRILQMLKVYIGFKSDKPLDEKSWAVLNAKLWKFGGGFFGKNQYMLLLFLHFSFSIHFWPLPRAG